ncbi:MAG: hypothetical protein EBU70_03070 [Actinobacteria bacterium]|nr:hypothetical protein [Actinomycetota bacterium]
MAAVTSLVLLAVAPADAAAPAAQVPSAPRPAAAATPVDFNVVLNLAGIAQRAATIGALNCVDGGRTYASGMDMFYGLSRDPRLLSSVTLSCQPAIAVDASVQQVTGTFTVPSKGIADGVITANCSAKAGISASAALTVGLGVPGLIAVNVSAAGAPLPIGCDFLGESASTGTRVTGTIAGFAQITGMCSSACVALSLSAEAIITSTTGVLAGQTGRGTYEYRDAFELPALTEWANTLAALRPDPRKRDRRVACPEGAEDCSVFSTSPCPNGAETCTTTKPETQQADEGSEGQPVDDPNAPPPPSDGSAPADSTAPPSPSPASPPPASPAPDAAPAVQIRAMGLLRPAVRRSPARMLVVLGDGPSPTVIARPLAPAPGQPATIGRSAALTIAAAPGSSCTTAFSAGKRTVRRTSVVGARGTVSVPYSRAQMSALMRQLGASRRGAANPTVSLSVGCGTSAPAVTQVQLAG